MFKDISLFFSQFTEKLHHDWCNSAEFPAVGQSDHQPARHTFSGPIQVLEVGPGTGAFTRQILKHLRSGDRLEIYELNARFCEFLRQNLPWE